MSKKTTITYANSGNTSRKTTYKNSIVEKQLILAMQVKKSKTWSTLKMMQVEKRSMVRKQVGKQLIVMR